MPSRDNLQDLNLLEENVNTLTTERERKKNQMSRLPTITIITPFYLFQQYKPSTWVHVHFHLRNKNYGNLSCKKKKNLKCSKFCNELPLILVLKLCV